MLFQNKLITIIIIPIYTFQSIRQFQLIWVTNIWRLLRFRVFLKNKCMCEVTWCGVKSCTMCSNGSLMSGLISKRLLSAGAGSWSSTCSDWGLVRWQHLTKPSHTFFCFHTYKNTQHRKMSFIGLCAKKHKFKLVYERQINQFWNWRGHQTRSVCLRC